MTLPEATDVQPSRSPTPSAPTPRSGPRAAARRGFSLLEVLIAGAVVTIAGLAGVAYVVRSTQHSDGARDRVFARQKAISILQELRAYVEGGEGEVAADLDGFDDGLSQNASLTIAPDPRDPGAFLPPGHPLSGNITHESEWRWYRRITVQRFPGVPTRDLRLCTVRIFRHHPRSPLPGDKTAEVSTVIRTIGDAYPTSQVYDVYLLALENVPGWWVYMDSIKPFVDSTLADLEARNPGLVFRPHWITTSGYGRDERYAPYVNDVRVSTDSTPWAYVYPGTMPVGSAAEQYYVPDQIRGRMNRDGVPTPVFQGDYALPEPYVDANANGRRDPGEAYTDSDGDEEHDVGNSVPYAIADMHNHAMRWPDENAKFQARVAAGIDDDEAPTWRLLLDRMIADPASFHNAILINLHGELLPMPPVRNVSDAAKDPAAHPGWRAVTHPERLRPRRIVNGSDPIRYRVYGYKTEFTNVEKLTTLREPFRDVNRNGVYDAGDGFTTGAGGDDWNGNGRWDDACPVTVDLVGADYTSGVNAAANPSLVVQFLPGGIDADGSGAADPYLPFANARRYPEVWTDSNADGLRNVAEAYFDRNGNGVRDAVAPNVEPYAEVTGNTTYDATSEAFVDVNANARFDRARPKERFTDTNANGRWDPAEPYWDRNTNGVRDGPTIPTSPWRAWNPAVDNASATAQATYVQRYGEPFKDVNANNLWNAAEPFVDDDFNGVCDGGYSRGEMWFEFRYDPATTSTVLTLHGTPLECPETADGRGLDATARLYDLEYVPCPMLNTASAAAPPFGRDLAWPTVNVPKNTARWTIEIPAAQVKRSHQTGPGLANGDSVDRIFQASTRLGTDRTTGVMWPVANRPEDLSKTYCYFYALPDSVPFSERYQFQGDPRHSPYADTDRYGLSFANGYNWYFDNFATSGTAQANWLAFDPAVLSPGWLGRTEFDTPRYLQWLRTAVTKSEALWTTLTGFSYYYLSIGGDIGYDSANGFPSSIPVDGTPYGLSNSPRRYEDTITTMGNVTGWGRKLVRSARGAAAGIRAGGYWWSKPWIGELYQDSAWADQWVPWGNLRAGMGAAPGVYTLFPRGSVTTAQQPRGTMLASRNARLSAEGCTSLFNIGTAARTFHHQYLDGTSGNVVADGLQIQANYNFPVPGSALISRPFSLATSGSGGVGPEFLRPLEYPRYSASTVTTFFNHSSGLTGSSLVRLVEPGSARAGYVVVNGIDRTTESGSAFIARYSMLTLVHSFLAAGNWSGTAPRPYKQLPRVAIATPTIVTELTNPAAIPVQVHVEWERWDGLKYTASYPTTYSQPENELVYVLMYSRDGGDNWLNMRDDSPIESGDLPSIAGVGPDPAKTIPDAGPGDQFWVWPTPAARFPEGTYMIRVEAHRRTEALHYALHQEKIYVNR